MFSAARLNRTKKVSSLENKRSTMAVSSTGVSSPAERQRPGARRRASPAQADRGRRPHQRPAQREGDRQRQHPRQDDVPRHPPAHPADTLAGAYPQDRAVDGVGRADRDAEPRRDLDRRGGGGLGGKAVDRLQFREAKPHGPHDPPPPGGRPQPHRQRGGEHHPQRDVERGAEGAVGEERQRHDAPRLLPIVAAVAEGHIHGRKELQAAEGLGDPGRRLAVHEPVQQHEAGAGRSQGDERRVDDPHADLLDAPSTTARNPAVATPAPRTPNTSAWLELVGRPAYHVVRSQRIAAMSPEATVAWLIAGGTTSPLPTVAATAVPVTAPTKLRTPAIATATGGRSTRVATTVAIAFAAS